MQRVIGTVTVPDGARTVILSARTAPNPITLEPGKFAKAMLNDGNVDVGFGHLLGLPRQILLEKIPMI